MNNYDDIIDLTRPISSRNKMSMEDRAAQFSPFAALRGYSDEVKEVSRYTDEKIIIDEEQKEKLDEKLQIIDSNILSKPFVSITYFIKDKSKNGGKYATYSGNIKKIDKLYKKIYFMNGLIVSIDDIFDINYEPTDV